MSGQAATKNKRMTLEQQRATFAWHCARVQTSDKDYVNLAKGVPALIMNSGLIQVMAHLHAKGQKSKQHDELEQHIRAWLASRFDGLPGDSFDAFAKKLIEDTNPQQFQLVTAEAMAWLRWLRQIAPAVVLSGTPSAS